MEQNEEIFEIFKGSEEEVSKHFMCKNSVMLRVILLTN